MSWESRNSPRARLTPNAGSFEPLTATRRGEKLGRSEPVAQQLFGAKGRGLRHSWGELKLSEVCGLTMEQHQ